MPSRRVSDAAGGGPLQPVPDAVEAAAQEAAAQEPKPYVNPFRHATGLVLARTDQGVDYFARSGSVITPFGRGRVTRATLSSGWPGGGCVQYVLLDGPNEGDEVYVAEWITVHVQPGQLVDGNTVIARFAFDLATTGPHAYRGIETGFVHPGTHQPCSGDTSGRQTDGGRCIARLLRSTGCRTLQDPGPGSRRSPCGHH